MLRKYRAMSTFLIVSLCFIFPLASAYSNFNTLIEADFFSRGSKFEAGDLNDPWVDKQTIWDFMPSESSIMASPDISSHRLLSPCSYQAVSINPSFSVLRCWSFHSAIYFPPKQRSKVILCRYGILGYRYPKWNVLKRIFNWILFDRQCYESGRKAIQKAPKAGLMCKELPADVLNAHQEETHLRMTGALEKRGWIKCGLELQLGWLC